MIWIIIPISMFGIVTKMKIGWTAIETLNIFKLGIIVEERTQIPTFLLIKKGWNSHRYRFCGFRWILSCTCSALMIYHGYNAQNEWLYFNGGFHLIGFFKISVIMFQRIGKRKRKREKEICSNVADGDEAETRKRSAGHWPQMPQFKPPPYRFQTDCFYSIAP